MARKPKTSPQGNQWLQEYVPYLLYRATNRLNARLLARLKSLKVSPGQWRILSVLRAHGTLNLSEIVEHTLMEQPTISRVVNQLELDGRVTRQASSADSRMINVNLTEAGLEAFEAIVPFALKHEEMALHGISKKELQQLVKTLEKIEDNIALFH